MADPQIISRKVVYLDDEGNEVKPGTKNSTKHEILTYASGQIWDSVDGQPATYLKTDPQLADYFKSQNASQAPKAPQPWPTSDYVTDSNGRPVPNIYAKKDDNTKDPVYREINGTLYQMQGDTAIPIKGVAAAEKADPYASSTVIAAQISQATQMAQLAWAREQQAITNLYNERKMTLDEAKAKSAEIFDQIKVDLDKKTQELSQRGQDIDMRGQDITGRGQDMNFASNMAQTTVDAYKASLPYMAPKGSTAAFNTALGNVGNPNPQPVNAPTGAFPFDPAVIVQQAVARSMGLTGGQFSLPGGPAPVDLSTPKAPTFAGYGNPDPNKMPG